MTNFGAAYKKLNDAQRKAVDYIDGPLLVVAGPGTGKTELLSVRAANILQKTDTDPSSILCLTFTNKAAANMRERLFKLIGSPARRTVVKTFHSFAAEIMNSYPEYFWNGARLVAAPDAVQLDIITSILGDLPLSNPLALRFAGKFTEVKPVQQALKLAKEAGLTPEKLRDIIELNLKYIDVVEPLLIDALAPQLSAKRLPGLQAAIEALPSQGLSESLAPLLSLDVVLQESLAAAIAADESSGKATHVSKWKARWLQTVDGQKGMHDERRRNAWWLSVSRAYQAYRDALHARGYYDYADMVVEVISQLEQHADLRSSAQERFLYVMIDEFQDTNAAQMRLSHLVADHFSANGSPNIMAVGDDDQAIYKFNGAELSNMLSFRRLYPTAKLIVLTDNYRSTQNVLDAARRVIELAEDRLVMREPGLDKQLRAASPPDKAGIIQHASYPSRDHQFSHVAATIRAELVAHPKDSIAVLARNHNSLRQMAGLLGALDVGVAYEQSNNVLEHPVVGQILRISQLVVAIQGGDESTVNALIVQVLRHPMWRLDTMTIWQLATENYGARHWLKSLIDHRDAPINTIGHWLLWLAAEADNQPLAVIIEFIIGLRASEHLTSPLREYYLGGTVTDEYLSVLSAIKVLRTLVDEFAGSAQPRLQDFVQFIETMQSNSQVIADESPFLARVGAVQLLTVHKAKGLEFDSVYIVDAIEANWQPAGGSRKPPANLPLKPAGDDSDDYVRLLYVALTRARHSLHISSYRSDEQRHEVLASPLVSTTIANVITLSADDSGNPIEIAESSVRWPRLPVATERELLQSRLSQYSLSATHLLDFLDVTKGGPQAFLETKLLALPEARSSAAAFGNAMHAAMERAQNLVHMHAFDITDIQNTYEQALLRQRLPVQEFDRYLVHGQGILEQLFASDKLLLPDSGLPEQRLTATLSGGEILYGKVDRIDELETTSLRIVDYKTGTPLPSFATRDKTLELKAWRHRTQLQFYALLALQSGRFPRAEHVETSVIYLEAESPRQLTLNDQPSGEDLARLTSLISTVWQHIMTLNLPDTNRYEQNLSGIKQFEDDLLSDKI